MLFSPMTLGELELPNRLVMAPLTRLRSGKEGIPGPLVVEHYRQRASLGLIVSEGTYPSHAGRGFPGQPGLVTPEQLEGWANVTAAVHAEGGRIFAQVMHAGRVTHEDTTGGHEVVAPSAIAIDGETRTYAGQEAVPRPARPDHRGTARHRRGICHGVAQSDRGRIRRRRAALCQRLPPARIPDSGGQPARRHLRRLTREPGALRDRSGGRPWWKPSARTASASASRRSTTSRVPSNWTRQMSRRPTAGWWTPWRR